MFNLEAEYNCTAEMIDLKHKTGEEGIAVPYGWWDLFRQGSTIVCLLLTSIYMIAAKKRCKCFAVTIIALLMYFYGY